MDSPTGQWYGMDHRFPITGGGYSRGGGGASAEPPRASQQQSIMMLTHRVEISIRLCFMDNAYRIFMSRPDQGFPMGFWPVPLPPPQVRTVEEMRSVLANPDCPATAPLYCMYRDLSLSDADAAWLREEQLRYDMTIIPARILCGEFVKTKGHFHPVNPRGVRYPEIYEVLGGAACFLLQDEGPSDVVAIVAGAGEKVVVPPGYGHVTLNMARVTLTMVNIVSTAFESVYGEYEERRGAAYYAFSGQGFVPNPRYESLPPVRVLRARDLTFLRDLPAEPLYRWIGNREALGFLNRPEEYPGLLSLP